MPTINKQPDQLNTSSNYLLNLIKIVLALTVFCLINPLTPVMPSSAPLDPSWVIGLNQAVAQKLQFGQELIFTFGPYASIYTKAFHPATNHLELLGSIYLSALYILVLLLVIKRVNFLLPLGICILFAGFITHLDAVFYSYALLVAIYCWQPHLKEGNGINLLTIGILFSGFGLYPLIKGPLFVLYLPVTILSILLFISRRRWLDATIIPLSITITMFCFWLYASQNLSNLPSYFLYLGMLIDGFSQAMSAVGNTWEIVAYIGVSGLIAAYIINRDGFGVNSIYLLLVFSLYLFVSFKAGFVRHDGHSLIGGEALILSSLLVVAILPTRSGYLLILLALVAFLKIESDYKSNLARSTFEQIQRTYRSTWQGAKVRILEPQKIEGDFKRALRSLRQLTPLPKLNGKSDIFPFDQTYLIASGNTWNPRPVFQSYHAYTEKLASANKVFIESADAPDNVFFRIESIDGRFPAGDDGMSWPTLLAKYQPDGFAGQYLILKKNSVSSHTPSFTTISLSNEQLNTWVELPNLDQAIWASVDIQQSWIGKIKNLLFKSSPLGISIRLDDGTVKQFRLVAGNFTSPILLTPLIENAQEFNLLYQNIKSLHGKRIKAISIWVDGSQRDWQKTYELTLTTNK
jgi:hypothetical protein